MDPSFQELCELRIDKESLLEFIKSLGMESAYQVHRQQNGLEVMPELVYAGYLGLVTKASVGKHDTRTQPPKIISSRNNILLP